MGAESDSLKTALGIDTTDFKTGLATANRELRILESGFRASVSTLGDWGNSVTGLEARQKSLNSQIDLQKMKVEALRENHQRLADANGIMSISAQNAEVTLNKETERLGKMTVELDKTKKALATVAEGSQKTGDSFNILGKTINPLKGSWTELNSIMGVFKRIEGEVKRAIEQTVGVYVKRADAARELARLTGDDIETTSRLIEASDDLFISQSTLTSGIEFAIRKGYQPSVVWIKQMADQIMAIQNPADRAKSAIDVFGKAAGPELLKLLEKGSRGIDEYMQAIEDGLVVTAEAYQKAQKYKVALDNLNDALLSIEMITASYTIGPLTELMERWAAVPDLVKHISLALVYASGHSLPEMNAEILAAAKVGLIFSNSLKDDANAAEIAAAKLETSAEEEKKLAEEEKKLAEEAQKLSDKYTGLLSLTMDLTDENRDFQDTMQDLRGKASDLRGEISVLEGKRYLTEAQKNELEDLKTKLDDVTGAIEDTARAHEDASKRIVFSLLQAKLSADGLTTAEFDMLIKTGEAFGIIDSQSANTALAINGLTDEFIAGQGSVDDYYNRVKAILDLPAGKTFTFTTIADYYTYFHGNPGGSGPSSSIPSPTQPIIGYDPISQQPIYGQVNSEIGSEIGAMIPKGIWQGIAKGMPSLEKQLAQAMRSLMTEFNPNLFLGQVGLAPAAGVSTRSESFAFYAPVYFQGTPMPGSLGAAIKGRRY